MLFLHQYYQIGQVWYDNAGELSIFSLLVLSLPAEVLQVLQYMYRVHDPTITIAIGSVWLQLSSERVSLGAWKRGKTNSLVSDDGYLQVSRKKKLHMQLAYEGDQFKKGKNVSLLCCCHILVCHTKIKQMIHGSIEQWGNINGTDRHTANFMSFKSKPTDWDTCISKYVILSTKKVLECTSVQEDCSYIKTFLNHASTPSLTLTCSLVVKKIRIMCYTCSVYEKKNTLCSTILQVSYDRKT